MEVDFSKAIQLMKAGEEEGFNMLYAATCQKVYFRAVQCTKSEQDAQDVMQISYVEAYKNIDKLQAPEATLSWLYAIVYRQACKLYRNEREKREFLLSEDTEGLFEQMQSSDVETMPELSTDQKATAQIVRDIIEELPESQKMTVLAFYFDHMKLEEIAQMMDCSVNTVKSRLNYARKYMKDRVEEKEKKEGYKLHVLALPTILFAIKLLADSTTVSVSAAETIYEGSCMALGLQASSLSIAGASAGIAQATGATANSIGTVTDLAGTTAKAAGTATKAAGTASKAAGAAAKTSGVAAKTSAVKVAVIAGAVAIGGAATAGGILYSRASNSTDPAQTVAVTTAALVDGVGVTQDGLFEYDAQGDIVTLTKYIGDETEVVIPLEVAGRTQIVLGAKLFQKTDVTSVTITENVIALHDGPYEEVFRDAKALKSVTISGSVKTIPANTFYECTSLETVILEEGIEEIQDNAFFYCLALEHLDIPDSVKEIGQNVCSCTHVKEITVARDCVVDELNTTGFPSVDELVVNYR